MDPRADVGASQDHEAHLHKDWGLRSAVKNSWNVENVGELSTVRVDLSNPPLGTAWGGTFGSAQALEC